jgi:hypothetical protein
VPLQLKACKKVFVNFFKYVCSDGQWLSSCCSNKLYIAHTVVLPGYSHNARSGHSVEIEGLHSLQSGVGRRGFVISGTCGK